MKLTVTGQPQAEPIALAEAKNFLHAKDGTDEDTLIAGMIAAARRSAEHELGRYLITQTVEATLDDFPRGNYVLGAPAFNGFEIILPPAQAVASVAYVDSNGVDQVLASSQYDVLSKGRETRISPAYGVTWPYTRGIPGSVTVTFTGGYGADAAAVPECIRSWMFLRIKALYDNRDQFIAGTIAVLPSSYVDGLLDPERVSARL